MKQQRLQRLRRVVVGDDNPLRRYVDKLETAISMSLVIAFVVAAPLLAIGTVHAIGAAGARQQRAEATWRPVRANLTESAASGLIGLNGEWDTSWVTAKWIAPDGAHRTGMVPVDLNARAGQQVAVWVTPAGVLTHPPLTHTVVVDREVVAAIAVPGGLLFVLAMTAWVLRVLTNRRRMAAWTRAWEKFGPRWSSYR